jgi:hypothetical protein
MSPTPSADSHWHNQPAKSTQAPFREYQPEEMPSAILSRVAKRHADRHSLRYGNIPASHQNLPKQAPSAGHIGDSAPEDHSHHSSHGKNTEGLPQQSKWEIFDGVVGRLERKLKDVETATPHQQTTHVASTAQTPSHDQDQGNKSIGSPITRSLPDNN